MTTEQATQFNSENGPEPYKSMYFQLLNDFEGNVGHLPVAIKNLTTVGVILEILAPDNGLKTETLRGSGGFLKLIALDDRVITELPGKILWTLKGDSDKGTTLGLELLEPLPLPVRQMLEANMAIGAQDLKVLWDYWDEIKADAVQVESAKPVVSIPEGLDYNAASEGKAIPGSRHRWYWAGFGAILSGFAMQFLQSDYLRLSGVMVIFLGSFLVAFKSILSLRQTPSNDPCD